jgi:hypothetical protein
LHPDIIIVDLGMQGDVYATIATSIDLAEHKDRRAAARKI